MVRKLLIGVAVLLALAIVVVLALASRKPDSFKVERTALVQAPPEKITPLIEDFHQWAAWSPYEKLDPAMQRSFGGAARGKGAVYAWQGNSQAGAGRMEITEATPQRIAIRLDFEKPFKSNNVATFGLQPQGAATQVSWSMQGPAPLVSRVMQVFFDLDTVIGQDFETGLSNLKAAAEKP